MENGFSRWNFKGEEMLNKASACTIRTTLNALKDNLNTSDERPVIPLGHGDPSAFPSFRPSKVAEEAIIEAIQSAKNNSYAPGAGIPQARRSIAEYLSCDHPFIVSPDDVYITVGGRQAIDVVLTVLARPGANILLPKPGYSFYDARATFSHLEIRHFDLLPEQEWEIDLNHVEALADDKTVAIVIINPGNPCGNVYTYDHLQKVAETARKLGFLVIADEAYAHLTFGNTPFVPMQMFGSIVPVLTLGSLSKRWLLPGWRLGWIVNSDPNGILQSLGKGKNLESAAESQFCLRKHHRLPTARFDPDRNTTIVECLNSCLDISPDPATFIQAAVPKILKGIPEDFYAGTLNLLREAVDVCYDRLTEIPCLMCPYKPEGSMFVMVKLNLSLLEGINDDMDFCLKLSREESVVVLPGLTMGLKNWLRITFAVELSSLEDGLGRIQAFCYRHAKKQ